MVSLHDDSTSHVYSIKQIYATDSGEFIKVTATTQDKESAVEETTSETIGEVFDIAIIGGGPVGLYGAYYAGFRGKSVVVIDSLSVVGGQVAALYPEKKIYDVAGFPQILGRELIEGLYQQALKYSPIFLLGESVIGRSFDSISNIHTLTTASGRSIHTRATLISGGVGTFTPKQLPAARDFRGEGLLYFIPNPTELQNLDVVVVGGGDSAIDYCLMLKEVSKSVTIVHRRSEFRAYEASVKELFKSQVEVITDAEVTSLLGGERLDKVEITKGDEVIYRNCDRIVAALGFNANVASIRALGIDVVENRHIQVNTKMETNVDGIYAAGDIATYDGKVKLIAVGFGEAATAINNAVVKIDPKAHLAPGHSSDSMG